MRAVHHLAVGVDGLQRLVLLDAQESGMTWAEIGSVYGVSRQAAHRRFSDETIVPPDFYDWLLEEFDNEGEVKPALAEAAKHRRLAAGSPSGSRT